MLTSPHPLRGERAKEPFDFCGAWRASDSVHCGVGGGRPCLRPFSERPTRVGGL